MAEFETCVCARFFWRKNRFSLFFKEKTSFFAFFPQLKIDWFLKLKHSTWKWWIQSSFIMIRSFDCIPTVIRKKSIHIDLIPVGDDAFHSNWIESMKQNRSRVRISSLSKWMWMRRRVSFRQLFHLIFIRSTNKKK